MIACREGALQPLLGCYQPAGAARCSARRRERRVARCATRSRRSSPVLLEVDDPDELFDVNSPEDLLQAAAMLDRAPAPRR